MSFLLEFVRDPFTVGAIAPSSPGLARMVTLAVPRTGSPVVVELGPGTGAFTAAIQQRLDGRGRHIAVEINPRFARTLAARHPAVDVVNADAGDLPAVLARRGLRQADVVVSGLPWAAFGEDLQRDVLSSVVATLPPHGVFTTFAYVHARWVASARSLLRSVRSLFDEVVLSRTKWANLPPAIVYYCRRPQPESSSDSQRTAQWPSSVPHLGGAA
ncbi:methyltransferase domain-containing protein [Micromonospora sp. NPDC048835]|uniref:class I SAM-dependent methyltransferase n=1 Tax=Micromonospora sp. NPDC048835 TaxID=3155147 RepID=UPI003408344B